MITPTTFKCKACGQDEFKLLRIKDDRLPTIEGEHLHKMECVACGTLEQSLIQETMYIEKFGTACIGCSHRKSIKGVGNSKCSSCRVSTYKEPENYESKFIL